MESVSLDSNFSALFKPSIMNWLEVKCCENYNYHWGMKHNWHLDQWYHFPNCHLEKNYLYSFLNLLVFILHFSRFFLVSFLLSWSFAPEANDLSDCLGSSFRFK